mmetsp:Transcript_39605/g.129580  ORF Transcript_39605/g.129580 Transcript_39605/m.129580 type:complete len:336 (-) Transcript_39605:79-1086(-)
MNSTHPCPSRRTPPGHPPAAAPRAARRGLPPRRPPPLGPPTLRPQRPEAPRRGARPPLPAAPPSGVCASTRRAAPRTRAARAGLWPTGAPPPRSAAARSRRACARRRPPPREPRAGCAASCCTTSPASSAAAAGCAAGSGRAGGRRRQCARRARSRRSCPRCAPPAPPRRPRQGSSHLQTRQPQSPSCGPRALPAGAPAHSGPPSVARASHSTRSRRVPARWGCRPSAAAPRRQMSWPDRSNRPRSSRRRRQIRRRRARQSQRALRRPPQRLHARPQRCRRAQRGAHASTIAPRARRCSGQYSLLSRRHPPRAAPQPRPGRRGRTPELAPARPGP